MSPAPQLGSSAGKRDKSPVVPTTDIGEKKFGYKPVPATPKPQRVSQITSSFSQSKADQSQSQGKGALHVSPSKAASKVSSLPVRLSHFGTKP